MKHHEAWRSERERGLLSACEEAAALYDVALQTLISHEAGSDVYALAGATRVNLGRAESFAYTLRACALRGESRDDAVRHALRAARTAYEPVSLRDLAAKAVEADAAERAIAAVLDLVDRKANSPHLEEIKPCEIQQAIGWRLRSLVEPMRVEGDHDCLANELDEGDDWHCPWCGRQWVRIDGVMRERTDER